MKKRKIALFYDESTESGRKILEFLTPFDKRKQGVVGITSAINALIYCDNVKEAKDLYFDACNVGLPKNKYIEVRLKDI